MTIVEGMTETGTFEPIPSEVIIARLDELEQQNEKEERQQRMVMMARRYHDGEQGAQLTDRLQEYLNDTSDPTGVDSPFRLNVCANVVTAVAERLTISAFDCEDLEILEWIQVFWQRDALDAKQEEVHEGALRDGEYFVIADWDVEEMRPTFIPFERFTAKAAGGTGEGCLMLYQEDDPNQKPQAGVKYWSERVEGEDVEHRNIYYADRIEKWIKNESGEWGLAETVDWTGSDGLPLGVGLIHFKNKRLRPEAADAFPLQRAVNKSLLDLLSSSDLTAFRIFTSFGFVPTTDGQPLKEDRSNLLSIEPGQVVGTTLPPGQADFDSIDTAELNPQMDLSHQLILWLATTTNTPVSRFISTKLIASDETLKEQEGPLLSRAKARQITFGNAWVKCVELAVRMQNTFGEPVKLGEYNPNMILDTIWTDAQSRSQQATIDLLLKKKELGIPMEQLWREAGYSSQRIIQMKAMKAEEEAQNATTQQPGRESTTSDVRDVESRGGNGAEPGTGTESGSGSE